MTMLEAFSYKLTVDGADVTWELIEAVCDEASHELPRSWLDVESSTAFADLLGKRVRFELVRGATALVRDGYVVRSERMHQVDRSRHRARIHLSHKGFGMSLGRHCRIWEKQTPQAVMTRLAQAAGLKFSCSLQAAQRDRITQYFETDYELLRRLCEEVGAVSRWDPADALALEVVAPGEKDKQVARKLSFVLQGDSPTYPDECLWRFVREQVATVDVATTTAWDSTRKSAVVARGVAADAKRPFQRELTDEVPGVLAGPPWSLVLPAVASKALLTEEVSASSRARGVGNALAVTAGRSIEVVDETESGADGKFVVSRVQHRVTLTQDETTGAFLVYENEFECLAQAFPFRPARAVARPLALTPALAVVTGIPSSEAPPGQGLEIRVRMLNFVEPDAEAWVRLAQPFAGKDHGVQFLPHINDEVIVHFVDGDPEKPVVLGSLYSGVDKPPSALPGSYTRNVIRASPYEAGAEFEGPDEVFFEEDKSHRVLGINAAEDHEVVVGNDAKRTVKRDRAGSVGRDDTLTVKRHQTNTVEGDRAATVKGADKTSVEGNQNLTVHGNLRTAVFKKLQISADEGVVIQCGDNAIEISPSAIKLSIASGPSVELKGPSVIVQNGSGSKVTVTSATVTIENGAGAKVELAGPLVNLN